MKLSTLIPIALVALLVTAGAAAAMPGNAPDHAGANDHEQASDHAPDDTADDGDAGNAHAQGPPEDLPEQVPDFVRQIHDAIRQFLSGGLDGILGDAVSSRSPADSTENSAHTSG